MSDIDRQRISGVRMLEAFGFTFDNSTGTWKGPVSSTLPHIPESDAMHALLVERADRLIGSSLSSDEADELVAIGEALEAYEAVRWPGGKTPGGKG